MWVARKIQATAQPPALKVQLPFFFPTPHCCPQRDRFLFNRSTFTPRGRHFPASSSININHLIPAPSGNNYRSEEWSPPAQGSPQTLGNPRSLVLLCCSLPCSLTPSLCEDGTRQAVSLQRLGHSLFSFVLSDFPKNTNQGVLDRQSRAVSSASTTFGLQNWSNEQYTGRTGACSVQVCEAG